MIKLKKLRGTFLDPDETLYCVKRVLAKKGLYEIKKFIQLAKLEGRLSQKEIEIVGRNINILKEVL
ncbi:MAG TPA: hypothetical protein V6C58_08980, partial [Allocoleopsis sp.]